MATPTRYLFASNFERDADTGAAGSLIAIGEQLEKQGKVVDFAWSPDTDFRLRHPRLREIFELPGAVQRQVAKLFERKRYDYVIASQPHAFGAFEWLRKHHPATVLVNRTHGWEQRVAAQNHQLHWRKEPPMRSLLSRGSQLLTDSACARVVASSDGVIASSRLCADYIRKRHGLTRGRVAVIPHGVSAEGKPHDPRSGGRMLFVGQYLARKGSAVLDLVLPQILEAFPTATMTFVVPKESANEVRGRFQASGQERIAVLPWMARERLFAVYNEHDILLYPSLFEGFGKVFLEAMVSGLCVAGFAEGAITDIATCGRDALFVPTGRVEQFRELLVWALRHPAEVRAIGSAAAETARKYSWERTARETDQYCMTLRAVRKERYAPATWMAPVGQLSAASRARLWSFGPGTILRTAMLSSSSSNRSGADPIQAAAPMQSDRSIVTVKGITYS